MTDLVTLELGNTGDGWWVLLKQGDDVVAFPVKSRAHGERVLAKLSEVIEEEFAVEFEHRFMAKPSG